MNSRAKMLRKISRYERKLLVQRLCNKYATKFTIAEITHLVDLMAIRKLKVWEK
jgi:hypothetical protein